MRASDALALGILTACALGCAAVRERVSVNLPPRPSQGFAGPVVTEAVQRVQASGDLPQLAYRNAFLGSGAGEAGSALAEIRSNQERAYREARDELRRVFRAEARARSREDMDALALAYEEKLTEVYHDLRAVFEAHAREVGPLWTRLATLVGFPERPLRVKRGSMSSDFVRGRELTEVDTLRTQIARLDKAYRAEVARRVEDARQGFRLQSSELEAKRILALDAADARAEAEARKTALEVFQTLEQSMVQDVAKLPAVGGARAVIQSPPANLPAMPLDPGPAWEDHDREVRLAGLFARSKGYLLVAPGPGVRDATEEYARWKQGRAGR